MSLKTLNFKADGGSRTRTPTAHVPKRGALSALSYTDSIADPRGLILSDQLYSFMGRNYCDGGSRTRTSTVPPSSRVGSIRFELRRNKSPAVWASLGGLRGICAPYTQGTQICQSENKRSPSENRRAFARLWMPPSSPSAHSARFSTQPRVAMARYLGLRAVAFLLNYFHFGNS